MPQILLQLDVLNKRDNIAHLSLALEIAETISMHLKFQIKDNFDFLFVPVLQAPFITFNINTYCLTIKSLITPLRVRSKCEPSQ